MVPGPVKKTLASLRLTILLIISLTVAFLLGLVIPQKDLFVKETFLQWKGEHPLLVSLLDRLHFTEIYTSPLILFLWGLFFINLSLVMADRIPLIWRRCWSVEPPTGSVALQNYKNYLVLEGKSLVDLAGVLKGAGYKVFPADNALVAVRNRFSPLGTILFHLSFMVLLLGGVTTFYTKFRAEADVAVGEAFSGNYTRILKRPRIGKIPVSSFGVAEVKPTYFDRNVTVDLKVALDTVHGRKVFGINRPYRDGSLSFVINDIDMAPLFVLQDQAGKELDGAVVKLKVLGGREDSFKLSGYTFKTLFHPDYQSDRTGKQSGKAGLPQALKQFPESPEGNRDKEIVNPAFTIAVYRDNELLATGVVRPGESISFDGRRLTFSELSYWVHFYVGAERGLMIVYAGFLLMTGALVMRLWFFRREIRAVAEGETLHVAGRGEYFPTLFDDEFNKTLSVLKNISA